MSPCTIYLMVATSNPASSIDLISNTVGFRPTINTPAVVGRAHLFSSGISITSMRNFCLKWWPCTAPELSSPVPTAFSVYLHYYKLFISAWGPCFSELLVKGFRNIGEIDMVKVKLIDYIPTLPNEMEPGCTPRLWNMVVCNSKLLELSSIIFSFN